MNTTTDTMLVEVWSDVMCPFCYIGKRKFEAAIAKSEHKDKIKLVWKSFQLDPSISSDDNKDYSLFLQKKKGFSAEQTKGMLAGVSNMAREMGLDYHFEKAIVANSFLAHRFAHLAKKQGLQDAAEEALFKAHFTDGKDIGNLETLVQLGISIGIEELECREALTGNAFIEEVQQDQIEAQQIGVTGVPFFVFNRKYAISGAQETSVFSNTIDKAFVEWEKQNKSPELEITDGKACTTDGKCD